MTVSTIDDALDTLTAQVRRDLAALAYPNVDWVRPLSHPSGQPVLDAVVVGGGQSGLCIAFSLRCDGIARVLVVDGNPAGSEGPWERFARMDRLRTPRFLVGLERGLPSLSFQAYFTARYGDAAWSSLDRIARLDWADYLRWYRRTLNLPVRNDTVVESIEPDGAVFALRVMSPDGPDTILARRVVLATGYDGSGEWRVPPALKDALPADVCVHSNGPVDFTRAAGKRVGVLGHGAAAFDAALAALRHGAASVDLCYRRAVLPTSNPHRWFEFAGFLKHFPELDDATRWSVNLHVDAVDQPPARHSYDLAHGFSNFRAHGGSPWTQVCWDGAAVGVDTPTERFTFDMVVAATGSAVDLRLRPELKGFVDEIALWQDRYVPPAEERHPSLGRYPYLDTAYGFRERTPGAAPFLSRIFAFNFASIVSCGPHSTSISGHKYAVPRLVNGVTSSLFLEQQASLVPTLKAYNEVELHLPLRDGAPTHSLFGRAAAADLV